MTDPIKECVKWMRLRYADGGPGDIRSGLWADAIQALQAERDALATQLKGEKLWEERCADLEAQVEAMQEVCFQADQFTGNNSAYVPSKLLNALRKLREQEGK